MKFYRSWPCENDMIYIPDDAPRVIDGLPRLLMTGQNYKSVSELSSWPIEKPGFCMLEWDIALDPIEQHAFIAEALIEPREVLVAPYRYHDTWCMWQNNDGSGPTLDGRPIRVGEERCDSFGLGCIYFPHIVLTEFLLQMNKFGFTDATFGQWYRQKYGPVRVTWRIHPQHLHDYSIG